MVSRILVALALTVAFGLTGCLEEDYTFRELFTGKEKATTHTSTGNPTGSATTSTSAPTTTASTTPTTSSSSTTTSTTPTTSTSTTTTPAPGVTLITAPADPAVGTTWEYDISGQSDGSSDSAIAAKESRNGHDANRIEGTVTTSGSSGTTTTDSTAWNRRSDGAVIETQTSTDLEAGGIPYTITTVTTFDPPCRQIEYPVVSGDSYTVTCESTTETTTGSGTPTTSSSTSTRNVAVMGQESVTVPAGTFDTAHIRITVGGTTTDEWHKLDGCGLVKSVSGTGSSEFVLELTSSTCT